MTSSCIWDSVTSDANRLLNGQFDSTTAYVLIGVLLGSGVFILCIVMILLYKRYIRKKNVVGATQNQQDVKNAAATRNPATSKRKFGLPPQTTIADYYYV